MTIRIRRVTMLLVLTVFARRVAAQSSAGLRRGLAPQTVKPAPVHLDFSSAMRSSGDHHPLEGLIVGAGVGELVGYALTHPSGFSPLDPILLSFALVGAVIGFFVSW